MAKLLKLRGGTTSQHSSFTGADREVTVDTDKETLVVHNGSTAGGFPVMRNAVDDATPQLGGNLDVNGQSIVSASNGNIAITPNGSGKVILDGLSHPTADGSTDQFLKTNGSGVLSFATVDTTTKLDDLALGDAASVLATSAGNITIDAQGSDTDIIIKGTDGGVDTTYLTIDGSAAGAATFNNDVTAFSDKRLKTDISNIENGLDKVMLMQGVYYKRNDIENARGQIGVLAQDMEAILPEVVLTATDAMQTKSVDYGKLTAVLIEAVKELNMQLQELKQQINRGG
jgi:hypothetical protein